MWEPFARQIRSTGESVSTDTEEKEKARHKRTKFLTLQR